MLMIHNRKKGVSAEKNRPGRDTYHQNPGSFIFKCSDPASEPAQEEENP
jgi:hypothetical protein